MMNFVILEDDFYAKRLATLLVDEFCTIELHWFDPNAMIVDVMNDIDSFDWSFWTLRRAAFMAGIPETSYRYKEAREKITQLDFMYNFLNNITASLGLRINSERFGGHIDTEKDYVAVYKYIEDYVEAQSLAGT